MSDNIVKLKALGIGEAESAWMRESFYSDPKNRLAQNACVKQDFLEVCLDRTVTEKMTHRFNTKIDPEGKPMTNQKNSGRCWIFALLNIIRTPFMKKFNLEEFEFSQSYLFFCDKIERANYYLDAWVEMAKKGEAVDGRLMHHLLQNPSDDGGQWDMLVNLVNKYGLMPRQCFPETFACQQTFKMKRIVNNLLRKDCYILRKMVQDGKTDEEIHTKKSAMLAKIYTVCGICIGVPPENVVWEYYDKDKQYHAIGPITPLEFYRQHVQDIYNIDDKVCIVNDPRPTNPYNKMYTVDYLNNMAGSNIVLYNNQPIEVLRKLAMESIKSNEAVWFGCDVGKHFCRSSGLLDTNAHDFKLLFGADPLLLSKADRLIYGEMFMTHAMTFTGVNLEGEKTLKWR
ncbi:PREDICTED: bleomycin hydrolase-like isoform X2 [Priapulus caudatus]|nr:PREDICTED: bleomycin hydrolase-like isoform X2 [Priapulus caudatus]